MFGSTGLKVGGKVFAILVKGKLVVKLPKERVDALVESRTSNPSTPATVGQVENWSR